jgi:hypothetical protein
VGLLVHYLLALADAAEAAPASPAVRSAAAKRAKA